MTRRVRVCKEMPFMKKGEILYACENIIHRNKYFCIGGLTIHENRFDELFEDGWLSYVEEERTLVEKYKNELHGVIRSEPIGGMEHFWTMKKSPKQLASIATAHFKEKFDKAVLCEHLDSYEYCILERIREALFGKEEE